MPRQHPLRGLRIALDQAARAWLWWLGWALLLQLCVVMRPLLAMAWLMAGSASFLLYPRLGRSRWRLRRAATLELRLPARRSLWLLPAAVLLAAFAAVLTVAYHRLCPGDYPPSPDYPYSREPLGGWIIPLIGCLQAPLVEEFAFRGHLQGRLARRFGQPVAATAGAAAFAFCHFSLGWLLYYAAIGLILGYALVAARSIWAPVALHAAINFFFIVTWRSRGLLQDGVDALGSPALAGIAVGLGLLTVLTIRFGQRVEQRARKARRRSPGERPDTPAAAVAHAAYSAHRAVPKPPVRAF